MLRFEYATRKDVPEVSEFIKMLAEYEHMADEVVADVETLERGCGRFEWWCLDWNQPSIDFYKSMGAVPMDEWTVYRIAGKTLEELGQC